MESQYPVLSKATKQTLVEARDLPTEYVSVPEWGVTVKVRGLTAAESERYQTKIAHITKKGLYEINAEDSQIRLICLCAIDEHGDHVFDFNNPDDVKMLRGQAGAAVDRVFRVCQKLSGFDQDAYDFIKNGSGPTRAAASPLG